MYRIWFISVDDNLRYLDNSTVENIVNDRLLYETIVKSFAYKQKRKRNL